MTIANILAVVCDAKSGYDSLAVAFRTAKNLNAHVDALHVRSDPANALPLVGEAMSGVMVDEMMGVAKQEADSRADKARAVYEGLVSQMGIVRDDGPPKAGADFTTSWLEDEGVEEQIVALRACRADLIVLSRPVPGNETETLVTLNAALMQSGRPVLAAPPSNGGAPTNMPYRCICLFWNGSPEATRAVTAALPFLAAAEKVIVLRVEEEEWYAPTEDLEAFLTRHGVTTTVSKVLPRQGRTGQSLLIAANDMDADMLVMGAYTRSKLRQLIFGSVTGYIMENAPIPVLLCH